MSPEGTNKIAGGGAVLAEPPGNGDMRSQLPEGERHQRRGCSPPGSGGLMPLTQGYGLLRRPHPGLLYLSLSGTRDGALVQTRIGRHTQGYGLRPHPGLLYLSLSGTTDRRSALRIVHSALCIVHLGRIAHPLELP